MLMHNQNKFRMIDTGPQKLYLRGPGGCVLGESVSVDHVGGRPAMVVELNPAGRKLFPSASAGTPERVALEHGDLKLV